MAFEHIAIQQVRKGWENGLETRSRALEDHRPPDRWTPLQSALLDRLANGETIDQIEAGLPSDVRRADVLVALSILAGRGLIRAPNDHIEITNMGFAAVEGLTSDPAQVRGNPPLGGSRSARGVTG